MWATNSNALKHCSSHISCECWIWPSDSHLATSTLIPKEILYLSVYSPPHPSCQQSSEHLFRCPWPKKELTCNPTALKANHLWITSWLMNNISIYIYILSQPHGENRSIWVYHRKRVKFQYIPEWRLHQHSWQELDCRTVWWPLIPQKLRNKVFSNQMEVRFRSLPIHSSSGEAGMRQRSTNGRQPLW